jgi:hypothetical protein
MHIACQPNSGARMEFLETENTLLDKENSQIDTQTIAFNLKVEYVQLFFATLPQFAASHPAWAKNLRDSGCLEKEQ